MFKLQRRGRRRGSPGKGKNTSMVDLQSASTSDKILSTLGHDWKANTGLQ